MIASRTLCAFGLLALCTSALPQTRTEPEIDAFVKERITSANAPGLAVAVVQNGKVVFAKGYGLADVEKGVSVTPKSVMRIGSVTKQFTATMLMQLVHEGKLKLEQPARELLPDLPEAWAKVTLRQLLDHTSGIKSYTSLPDFLAIVRRVATPHDIWKTVAETPLDFEPGTKWAYNNTAYCLLGLIVEKVDGRPFAQSLKERITKPLGMDDTYFVTERQIVPMRADGYSIRDGKVVNAEFIDMVWPYSAGAMESTVFDLAKWDAALYGDSILPQSVLKVMWTRAKLADGTQQDYGFGWGLNKVGDTEIVEHGGGIHGFLSFIRRAPAKGLTVVTLVNSDTGANLSLAADIMGFIDPSLNPPEPEKQVDADPAATALDRKVFEGLLANTLSESEFSAEVAKVFTPEVRKSAAAQLGNMGEFKSFKFSSTKKQSGLDARLYRVTLGATTLTLTVARDSGGKIAGFTINP